MKPSTSFAALMAGLLVTAANAQQPTANYQVVPTPPATTAAPVATPPPPPLIDPAKELKGLALVKALKRGGYILYMRHASATVGADQSLTTIPNWWENCGLQRNLSDLGREQARKVGEAIRDMELPLEVVTSQFCRNMETARLMGFTAIQVTEDINHPVGQRTGGPDVNTTRYIRLTTPPKAGTNVLLISHTQGSSHAAERLLTQIGEAEIIVFLPDGNGGTEPLARITVADWPNHVTLEWAERAKAKGGIKRR